ncbi:hypothetical protein E2562_027034 [Oryza meyeriana var. granulata]|uniref:Uncharacterized protein n=1 Tax=Oryza meyeriana var. granulata TaxID=110450 RepID=A0A6G1C929_9ORYZ|nr:hypothetical protein E2562_027034 [Oryza meyeriana var. granulata]
MSDVGGHGSDRRLGRKLGDEDRERMYIAKNNNKVKGEIELVDGDQAISTGRHVSSAYVATQEGRSGGP